MKKIKFVFIPLLLLIVALTACQENAGKEQVAQKKADWSDTTAINKAIDRYYKQQVYEKGENYFKIKDPFKRGKFNQLLLQINNIYPKDLKFTSDSVAYVPVLMSTLKRGVIVDMRTTWQTVDTMSYFVVTEHYLQSVDSIPRYNWTKDGEYWKRENIEKSKKAM